MQNNPSSDSAAEIVNIRESLVRELAGSHPAGLREQLVFSTGSSSASIVFVGEAPGAEEERLGEPFVGPAGEKLNAILRAMGLSREEVYISNIVKFRPRIGDLADQGTRNRKPTSEEIDLFRPWLLREIRVIRPKVLVALGASAFQGLSGSDLSIGKARRERHEVEGIPLVATYHPSYLLRQEQEGTASALQAKRALWENMLEVMEVAGLLISERQRNYFRN
ncbi:MAG: uracil-DNA glycosylase family protein [Chthoniobacterales bacterium]